MTSFILGGMKSGQGPFPDCPLPAVRCARRTDLSEIIWLHLTSQPHFFWPEAGPAFLRLFYAFILRDCQGSLLVSEQRGGLAGFVAGFADPARLYQKFAVRKTPFLAATATCALGHPLQLRGLFKDMRAAARFKYEADGAGEDVCELITIGVQPRFRRQGHGRTLVRALIEAAKSDQRGQLRVSIDSNDMGMSFFYRTLGFKPLRCFKVSDTQWMDEYVLRTRKP